MALNLAPIFDRLDQAIAKAAADELPEIVAALARVEALARLRIARSASQNGDRVSERRAVPERYLKAEEVAARLDLSEGWVYDHQQELGAVKLSPRCVRFPERKLARYLASRRA